MTPIRFAALVLTLVGAPVLAATPHKQTVVEVKHVSPDQLIKSVSEPLADGATAETTSILADCSGQKFETSVEVGTGDTARRTKVKLCSRPGETKEQWIASLGEAATKIGANIELAPDSRDKLIAAINAEIVRLKS